MNAVKLQQHKLCAHCHRNVLKWSVKCFCSAPSFCQTPCFYMTAIAATVLD